MKEKNDYNGSKRVKKGKTRDIFSEYRLIDLLTYFKTHDRFSKYAFKSRDVTIKGKFSYVSIILGSTIAVIVTIINL